MKRYPPHSTVVASIVGAGVLPGLVSLGVDSLFGDAPRVNVPLHECLELIGGCIALAVAMLLLLRVRHEETSPHLLWVAAGLAAMGLMDGAHSLTPFGPAFSWIRSGATLVGGILFGLVWLPPPAVAVRRKPVFILVIGCMAAALALAIWSRPGVLPAPWGPSGYSLAPIAVNALGGVGFLSAALFFLRRYVRHPLTEDVVLASQALLFGTAGLLFGFSDVWAVDWWVRHAFRLLAYAIVLLVAYEVVAALYQRIDRHAHDLEARVRARTADLEAANATVRAQIRERSQAEEALAASTARYRGLFEHMLNGYAFCRMIYEQGKPHDFVYLEVNEAFERLTGLAKVTGRNVSEVIPGLRETNPELLDVYGRVAMTGQPELFETRVDALGIWFSVAVYSPARGHFVALFENITERKHAEESLRASEHAARERAEELETVMDVAPTAIWVAHDAQCHWITGNRTANAFYEADHDENVSAGPADGQHDTTRRFFRNGRELEPSELPMQEAAAKGVDVRNSELEVLRPSGGTLIMLGNASPLRDDDGRVRGCVAAFVDITDRKQAEEALRRSRAELEQRVAARTAELEAANNELEAFTYSVAHDLRAPLRHMDGFSRILLEEHTDGMTEAATRYVAQIRNSSVRMGRLIDDLLSLARVGRQEIRWQLAGLGAIAAEVIADLKREQSHRAIEWRIGTLPFVECDPGLIKVALENLFTNAVKFTRTRDVAVIEAGVTREDGQPVVFVRDNGVGFNMRYADKLFGVFQRLHRQEDFEGTGVGLATVQRIVHKHGGRVWAEAELDKGATFFFTLGTRPA